MILRLSSVTLIVATFVSARFQLDINDDLPVLDPNNGGTSINTSYYFDQLLDHNNPSLGTFKQRYFFSDEFWTGQGAPIVLMNPGEQSAEGFQIVLNATTTLVTAVTMSLGGAGVVIEHRYWGKSSPYQNLTTANMKYLTVDQAIEDTKYFIENVALPWKKSKSVASDPDSSPWVHLGCSYPGVLSAYTQQEYPNLFAAAWASSAPVQAQGDFWQYFEPIEEGMPKNCSKDMAAAIKTIDQILLQGSDEEKLTLKKSFGLENLEDGDFGETISITMGDWQDMRATSYNDTGEDPFFQLCDAIETHPDGKVEMTANGVGMPTALDNYAKWINEKVANAPNGDCPGQGGACYSTFNYSSAQYTDWTPDNQLDRQWVWMVCTEFGWFQDGDPGNYSSIVSSLVTEEWNLRQCNHMFPNEDGTPGNFTPDTSGNNAAHGGGWNIQANNLFAVNGQFDPWRSASLSSRWAPMFRSTPHQQVEVVKGGHHCWDWYLGGAVFNPDVKRVVDLGISTVKGWLEEWYGNRPNVKNSMPKTVGEFWKDILSA
ncbi:hypothetical protein FRC04_003523 [Tulasnella sp. 424]|nr:hypothetical protein FRC04_003523 [Tulasnella sp. 424]